MSQVYVVTKDEKPCRATLDEREACTLFDDLVREGDYRHLSVLALPDMEECTRVLLDISRDISKDKSNDILKTETC